MNILMMTNTYLPHVGGVANSVLSFTKELRNQGHKVIVVAPEYKDIKDKESDVIRIPAIQNFNSSDFSVVLPIPGFLDRHLEQFQPDIVHSHHPFLVGSTALRISAKYHTPLVYTYHTMFEKYTHYVPVNFPRMREFVVSLSLGYSNLADRVIAPSQSVADVLESRKVQTPINIIPTGIDDNKFKTGNGKKIRASCNIDTDAFVVGHIGRLAPEKNLGFLARTVADFLKNEPEAHFLIAGYGPSKTEIDTIFSEYKVSDRIHFLDKLKGRELVNAYHAMDVFVFSSKSETQGLVLVEAMASGVPVIALDASGVREVVKDGINGFLIMQEHENIFKEALRRFFEMPSEKKIMMANEAKKTTESFTIHTCVSKLINVYETLKNENGIGQHRDESAWEHSMEQIKTEWELFSNLTSAIGDAIQKKS